MMDGCPCVCVCACVGVDLRICGCVYVFVECVYGRAMLDLRVSIPVDTRSIDGGGPSYGAILHILLLNMNTAKHVHKVLHQLSRHNKWWNPV